MNMEWKRKKVVYHKKKRKSEDFVAWQFLLPGFSGVCIFVLVPFADTIRRSFINNVTGKWIGFTSYQLILSNQMFLLATKNTVRFFVISLPILMVLSFLLTIVVKKNLPKESGIRSIFLLPMAIPPASMVLLWKLFFHEHGLLNKIIMEHGGRAMDYMNMDWAFWIFVGIYVFKNTGYTMILWIAGLSSISEQLYEAAKVDGASKSRVFFSITLPLLRPSISMIFILSMVNTFKVSREVYLIAENYPHDSIYFLQSIFNTWFLKLDMEKMCSGAVLIAFVVSMIGAFFLWIGRDERK